MFCFTKRFFPSQKKSLLTSFQSIWSFSRIIKKLQFSSLFNLHKTLQLRLFKVNSWSVQLKWVVVKGLKNHKEWLGSCRPEVSPLSPTGREIGVGEAPESEDKRGYYRGSVCLRLESGQWLHEVSWCYRLWLDTERQNRLILKGFSKLWIFKRTHKRKR